VPCVFVVFKGQLLVPLVEPCCPAQSVCHITVSRLMSERILNISINVKDGSACSGNGGLLKYGIVLQDVSQSSWSEP